MLKRITAIHLSLLVLISLPLHAQNPLDDEADEDLEDIIDEQEPQILFYLPLDGDSVARTPRFKIRSVARDYDEELPVEYDEGLVGQAAWCYGWRHFLYPADVILDRKKGSLFFWFKWNTQVKETPSDMAFVNGTISLPDSGILNSQDGKWHNYVITWNAEKKKKHIYRDGKLLLEAAMSTTVKTTLIKLGWKCRGLLDEVYFFDRPLEEEAIRNAIKRANKKSMAFPEATKLVHQEFRYPVSMKTAKEKRPRLPGTVNWELKPVDNTATSVRFDLSGYWRVQPFGTQVSRPNLGFEGKEKSTRVVSLSPQPGEWAYSKFPGSWRPTGPSRQGGILSSRLKLISRWNDVDISFYPAAWLERDFVLSDVEESKGVFLVMNGVHDGCDLYVNDAFIGSVVPWQVREFNVSHVINRSGNNRVSIMAGRPYARSKLKKRDGETVWLPSGLSLPVHLDIRQAREVSFHDIIPIPQFRKKSLDVEFWATSLKHKERKLRASCRITDTRTKKVIKLPSVDFSLNDSEQEMKTLSFKWEDPILWFPDDPHLLDLALVIHDGDKVMDESFPVRFGFREVWAEKGDFWMNGVRFSMQGQCHSFPGDTYDIAKNTIHRLGLIGFRSSIAYFLGRDSMPQAATEATLKAADEKGFLFNFKLYGSGGTAKGELRSKRDYFRQLRSHPSAVCYTRLQYGYHGPAHASPISLGRHVEEKEKDLPAYKGNQALVDLCHKLNPGSLVAYYQQGVVGDYRSYMQYLGYGTPIQTREEWPRYWSEQRPSPFFGAELDICSNMYLWRWQKGFRTGRTAFTQGTPPLATEHAARYFGPEAYERETLESAKAIKAHADKEAEYDLSKSANAVALKAFMIENTSRAWRTYGISYLLLDDTKITYRPDLKLNEPELAYQRNNARFLAYIGGRKEDFVRKDHAFFSGESVQKQFILINGKFHPVKAEVQWRLVKKESGKVVRIQRERLQRVKAGDIFKLPVEFVVPDVQQKTHYTLAMEVLQEGEMTRDAFDIEVFPSPKKTSIGKTKTLVFDEQGDTLELLQKAGVAAEKVSLQSKEDLAGADLLIIGRSSYPKDTTTANALFKAAEAGLNILCFEQTEKEVFGLKNDDPNSRHAFISAPDHPVVKGLANEDFRNWRGASNILEPYPDYRKGIKYGLLDHKKGRGFFGQNEFAHWSSNGTVASFHFEKPQTGSFKTILSSGFDLLYSPLIELRPGKGKILLCQLDVTNRYGVDPVATRITNSLLEYSAQKRKKPNHNIAWWGSPYWGNALGELKALKTELKSLDSFEEVQVALLGIDAFSPRLIVKRETADQKAAKAAPLQIDLLKQNEVEAEDDEFIGDDEATSAKATALPAEVQSRLNQLQSSSTELKAFLERGGTLVIPFVQSKDDVKWLPFEVKVEEKEVHRSIGQSIPELSGASVSDFFFREVIKLPVITQLPRGSELQQDGLFGSVKVGKGKVIFCQLYPELFSAPWQRTKVLRLLSTMLTNLGVGFEAFQDGVADQGLSQLFYSAPALDFNPDQHTSW
jgi:hypothetical protein